MKQELEVVAAFIDKNDKILLCQRHDNDKFGGLWEFPGGTIEKNETPEAAIEREIEEETGLLVLAKDLISTFSDENETLKIKVRLFRCLIRGGTPSRKDCQDFGFFSLGEVEKLALAPVDKKICRYLKQTPQA